MPSLQVSVPGQAVMSASVPAPACAQASGHQLGIQGWQVGLADPAQHDVLLDRGAGVAAIVAPRRWRPERASAAAVRSPSGKQMVATAYPACRWNMTLVCSQSSKTGRIRAWSSTAVLAASACSSVRGNTLQVGGQSSSSSGMSRALFDDQAPEFVDAEFRHQEFEARPRAVALFAQARKHPRDGLRQRQNLVFRHKRFEQLAPGAAPTPGRRRRSTSKPRCSCPSTCCVAATKADVVHVRQAAGFLRAAGKGDFELCARSPACLYAQAGNRPGHAP